MKKILIITDHLPYRNVPHAGGKNIYDFMVHMKNRGLSVYLVSLVRPSEAKSLNDLQAICEDARTVISEPALCDSFFQLMFNNPILFIFKLPIAVYRHAVLRRQLNRLVKEMIDCHQPDIIQVEYTTMAVYLNKIQSKKPKLLDLHDLMQKPARRLYLAEKQLLWRLFRYGMFRLIRWVELWFCHQFDLILTRSTFDKDLLSREGNFRIAILTVGINNALSTATYDEREPNSVLFVGAMSRDLNEKAVLYFIEHILPKLKERLGQVKFYIVGDSPSRHLQEMSSDEIIVTGFVEDLSYYFNRCRVFVAPLFIGGGLIFKILQAMSFKLPVVSTSIANEGVAATQNRDILIADNAPDFCDAICSLMTDRNIWDRLSNNGRVFVDNHYSWDRIIDDYLQTVESI